jgi:type IV pilus assembly protein PilW
VLPHHRHGNEHLFDDAMTHNEMNARRLRVSCGLPRMAGLSLVELLVAVAIGLLLLAGLVSVFVNTSVARNEIERSGRMIENGRYAVELLADDLRLAGFYGELNVGALAAPGALPDPCSTTAAVWKSSIPLHLQGYDASNGGLACLLAGYNYKTGTDVVVVRRARACVAGVAGCSAVAANTSYVQVSLCATELPAPKYELDLQSAGTFNSTIKDCTTAAGLRQYLVYVYFISTDNGAGQNVPTLKRIELPTDGTTVWPAIPLVEGIEQLNIDYGIDYKDSAGVCVVAPGVGDGLPDAYTSDPTNFTDPGGCATTPVSNWMNVMTAQYYVLARNVEVSPGYTDTKTYNLGSASAGPFSDGYRRHVYSGVVRIANAAGRRDTP